MQGLDYSAGAIPGAAIRQAGYGFVIRYVDDPAVGLGSKHITPQEYRDLVGAGVQVLLVFEVDTGDALGGYNQGVSNAQRARKGADWIGYPQGAPIFMACDMHLTGPQVDTAMRYLDGARSVLGSATGCYGFWEDVDTSITQHNADWFWQCGIKPADSDPVHIWQRNDTAPVTVGGVSCDINELLRPIGAPDMDWTTPMPAPGDWAGNPQTLASILNHIDQRVLDAVTKISDVHRVMVEPGSVTAHDPSHTKTNVVDLIADSAAWQLAENQAVTALAGQVTAEEAHLLGAIKGITSGTTDANAVAAALVPLLPKQVAPADFVAAIKAQFDK